MSAPLPESTPPVARVAVHQVALPLLEPFVTGFGVTTTRTTVLVHVVDADGAEGWGEAPALDHPYYLPETTSSTFALIAEHGLARSVEAASTDPRAVAGALAPIRGNTFAKAGIEAAYWALTSARTGRPLASLLGGRAGRIPVGESLGIAASVEETLDEVALRLAEGYRRIKLKIRPGWDVQVVRAVRERFGDQVPLQVDANAAYRREDADALAALDEYGLICIEQPLGYDDLEGSAALQARLRTPICLDEAIRSPADARRALDLDACRNVNLKPGRVGGLLASLEIHDLCVQRGVPLWCGGMLESGIGRAGNLALCSLPGFTQPADMSPASVLYADDLVEPTYHVDPEGHIAVPTAPGLGFPVVAERIARRTVRSAEWDSATGTVRDVPLRRTRSTRASPSR